MFSCSLFFFLCSCVRVVLVVLVVLASLCCSSFASHEPTKVARPCQRVRCQHSKKQSQGQQPKKQRRARALHDKKRPPQRTQQVRPCALFCCDCFFVLLLTLFLPCFSFSVSLPCFSFSVSLPCFSSLFLFPNFFPSRTATPNKAITSIPTCTKGTFRNEWCNGRRLEVRFLGHPRQKRNHLLTLRQKPKSRANRPEEIAIETEGWARATG